jgi:polyphosphate kinase 2 (PPK2 family)
MVFALCDNGVSADRKQPSNRHAAVMWGVQHAFFFPHFFLFIMLTSALPDHEELMQRIARDLIDSYDEELELEIEDRNIDGLDAASANTPTDKAARQAYFKELFRLQGELVKLQDWVQHSKQKVVMIFRRPRCGGQGRRHQAHHPAAQPASGPRGRAARAERPRTHAVVLPALRGAPAGRRRDGAVRPQLVQPRRRRARDGFLHRRRRTRSSSAPCPSSRSMLVRSGIKLIKYWFSITDDEQHMRFSMPHPRSAQAVEAEPDGCGKPPPLGGIHQGQGSMLERTHIPEAPWWVVQAVDKKKARLNCISHLLGQLPYQEVAHPPVELPSRVRHDDYLRQPVPANMMVPEIY